MKRSVPAPIQQPAAPGRCGDANQEQRVSAGYGDVLEKTGEFRMHVERHGGGVEDRHRLVARIADEGAHDC